MNKLLFIKLTIVIYAIQIFIIKQLFQINFITINLLNLYDIILSLKKIFFRYYFFIIIRKTSLSFIMCSGPTF